MADYWSGTSSGSVMWSGTTAGSGGWNFNVTQPAYQQQHYQQYAASNFKVSERSDAKQINEGWDGDQNPT